MTKRLLVQTQLSSIDANYKFVLEHDSGWQMSINRIREMLRLNPDLVIDVMGPRCAELGDGFTSQVKTEPWDVNPDLWNEHGADGDNRLRYVGVEVVPHALAARFDFKWTSVVSALDLGTQAIGKAPKYDAVLLNDPMHLRTFKAIFNVVGRYAPKFYVHSHFVDVPSCPKFPSETSLWLGQCEAASRADHNFWQCASALAEFEREARKTFRDEFVDAIMSKSTPWDDGYSRTEITSSINHDNIRFDVADFKRRTNDKVVLFFPNRISTSSGDYTNGFKFIDEILPALARRRSGDFVVIANPSKYYSRAELVRKHAQDGYLDLVDDGFNRDEYKFIASMSDIVVGLYDADTYGGTASRECIELGCVPLWLDTNEYRTLVDDAVSIDPTLRDERQWPMARVDFSDIVDVADELIDDINNQKKHMGMWCWRMALRGAIRRRCSFESTTADAMRTMCLLP